MHGKQWLSCASLSLLLMLFVTACSGEPDRYRFTVDVAGGPKGWPVWVEDVTFDNAWGMSGGSIRAGIEQRPPRGGGYILGSPKAAPGLVTARWFSYRNRTFYEINLKLPDDMDEKLEAWYDRYPRPKYTHYLIVGFSGKGEALVWWNAFCSLCGHDRSQDFSTAIIKNAKATIIEGDAKRYEKRIQYAIDTGVIPPPK